MTHRVPHKFLVNADYGNDIQVEFRITLTFGEMHTKDCTDFDRLFREMLNARGVTYHEIDV